MHIFNDVQSIITYLLVFSHFALAVFSIYHILLYKRDPRSATGWLIVCVFMPFAGPIAYYLFGINRVRLRAQGLRRNILSVGFEVGIKKPRPENIVGDGLHQSGYRITGKRLSTGNSITAMHNGDVVYPAMIDAIKNAKESVFLATYILKADTTGLLFANTLKDAAARGVDVKVLVDGIGELYSLRKISTKLKHFGVQTARFLPPKLFPPSIYINLRNHRKLLIVDNNIAFAGGMNIGSDHVSTNKKPRSVTDIHFLLKGPVVRELKDVFCDDWTFATGAECETKNADISRAQSEQSSEEEFHFPADCRVVPDGPDHEMDALALTIQAAVSSAAHTIDIMTPYFLPSRELTSSLQSAALRGVKIRIVLPKKNNLFYIHWAHRNFLLELLRWDVEVYYQPEPFCHSKIMSIDNHYALVGSANLDPRSLRLNFEIGIEVFSEEFNQKMTEHFNVVIQDSEQLLFEQLEKRSVVIRLRDSAAALLSPYL